MAITDPIDRSRRLLVICTGNICRSPAAEAILRTLAAGSVEVRSRGTDSWNLGQPAHAPMIRLAAARGYDLRPHRAAQVTEADVRWADEILVMQPVHRARLARAYPEHAAKVRLLHPDGVPDPYDLDDISYGEVLDLIERAARAYLEAGNGVDRRPRHGP
jgi:low molecular weight protein-tyrosine phosphatase